MNLTDKLVLGFAISIIIMTMLFFSHERGRESLCHELGGDYSLDFSRCVEKIKQIEVRVK
jgi:hypothetical protein